MEKAFKYQKGLLLVLVTSLFLSACETEKGDSNNFHQGGSVSARIGHPQLQMVTQWEEFTGRFQAMYRVDIRARVGGYLQDIQFEDGQIVNKDEVLFVIDQRPYQIALERAQARFELADREYKRAKGLHSAKAISEEDYDQRLQEQRIAKTDLDEAKLNMEFTEVKAPFDGRISRNRVDIGSLISGGNDAATSLTTLVSINPIEFYFEASESNLLNYMRARERGLVSDDRRQSHPVFVKLKDEDDFVHEGKVDFVDNEINADTSTIQVRAVFENKNGLLEPGLFARLRVAWRGNTEMIVIPPHVIGTEQTRKYVYVLDENNKAIRKYVTLGTLTDEGMRVIRDGLSAEDKIIVGKLHMIRPNVTVTPAEGTEAEEEREAE